MNRDAADFDRAEAFGEILARTLRSMRQSGMSREDGLKLLDSMEGGSLSKCLLICFLQVTRCEKMKDSPKWRPNFPKWDGDDESVV